MECIDDLFIRKWQPESGKIAAAQAKYDSLIEKVNLEISGCGTLTSPVFIEVINWKSPRIRPIFLRRDYREYAEGLRECLKAADDDKLPLLDALHGIGAPVASALLHFCYPESFPIIDFRTAQALYHRGYTDTKTVSGKTYSEFRRAVLEIKKRNSQWTLREIDLALFNYHKKELAPGLKRKG